VERGRGPKGRGVWEQGSTRGRGVGARGKLKPQGEKMWEQGSTGRAVGSGGQMETEAPGRENVGARLDREDREWGPEGLKPEGNN